VPENVDILVADVSRALAEAEPGLTFEFVTVALREYGKQSSASKHHILKYLDPWIKKIGQILEPKMASKSSLDQKTSTNDSCGHDLLRQMIEATIEEKEVFPID
jgi:hypothetical protein